MKGYPCLKAALEYLARGWVPVVCCDPAHANVSDQHRPCPKTSCGQSSCPSPATDRSLDPRAPGARAAPEPLLTLGFHQGRA
jgi:hypothetical protein